MRELPSHEIKFAQRGEYWPKLVNEKMNQSWHKYQLDGQMRGSLKMSSSGLNMNAMLS